MQPLIVSIGELLIDRFPDADRPGGAPANVAYHLSLLGNNVELISAIGDDPEGDELLHFLSTHGVSSNYVQVAAQPTGLVHVQFQENGDASYEIVPNAAWDSMQWNEDIAYLASLADAVCFSTLAQRGQPSREAVRTLLSETDPSCLRVLDLNLRPPHYSSEIIQQSLHLADVLKVNREEFDTLKSIYMPESVRAISDDDFASELLERFQLRCMIVTLGREGSRYYAAEDRFFVPALHIDVTDGDSVGVGDAFISSVIHHLLKQTPPETMMDLSNRYAALVAAQKGAMASVDESLLRFFR